MNRIYLRRKNKIIIEKGNRNSPNIKYIATILKNIENLGYTFSNGLIEILSSHSDEQLKKFYLSLIPILKEFVGANRQYNPMYPNFPEQVMEMEASKLYFNAIIHYWSLGSLRPVYNKEERFPLYDADNFKVITVGSEEDFLEIFKNLLQSKTSISAADTDDMVWLFETYRNKIVDILPNEIPLKENVALVSKLVLQYTTCGDILYKYVKTATDVLRLAVSLSDGDVSLAANTKFKSFTRRERRLLLSLLNNCNNIEEDMKKYKNRWIRLGERLHPSEYKTSYLKAQQAFYKLRNNEKIETFNSKLYRAITSHEYKSVVELLKQRSGEFARKLDHLLRICPNSNMVLNEFKDVARDISTPVLLQVREHFKFRNREKALRAFFPKGSIAKIYGIPYTLPQIDKEVCESVVKICEDSLLSIFQERHFLGNVYIDKQLTEYLVPFSQRSASKALRTIVRGSKISISEDTKTIRPFIYWKEPKDIRVDIDLSAVMYDENWNYVEHISYTNLKSNKYNACHSGDITSAPNGASEFIDMDIDSIKKYGGRYIIMSIHSFTEQPYSALPECFMGWMSREFPNSGEIYEPKTVVNKADITANTKICIPMILDLFENKVIWTDIALTRNPNYYNNVEGNKIGLVLMGRALTSLIKPNLYDLFELHVKARGIKCENIEDADVIFSLEQGITPYDHDVIVSQYL